MTAILRWTVRIHKWLALLVGIQIVLWVAGGAVMSLLDIDNVHGDQNVAPVPVIDLELASVMSPAEAAGIAGLSGVVKRVDLIPWLGRAVYQVEDYFGSSHLVDAHSGERLTPISEATAIALAEQFHLGALPASSTELLETSTTEYRGADLPAWRVNFDDGDGTSLYYAVDTGLLTSRRNDEWRLFDFVWMLHIMGYQDRDDFNTIWLQAFALFSLVTVFAGLLLLFIKMRRSLLMALGQEQAKTRR
ncbi:PepSY domain-containing protein [Maricaulis sp.]|uniref:PepSY domain-containing protein n=1 Tax=Maricaulis sp. TaxID=1486257 RepID=UPI003A934748